MQQCLPWATLNIHGRHIDPLPNQGSPCQCAHMIKRTDIGQPRLGSPRHSAALQGTPAERSSGPGGPCRGEQATGTRPSQATANNSVCRCSKHLQTLHDLEAAMAAVMRRETSREQCLAAVKLDGNAGTVWCSEAPASPAFFLEPPTALAWWPGSLSASPVAVAVAQHHREDEGAVQYESQCQRVRDLQRCSPP